MKQNSWDVWKRRSEKLKKTQRKMTAPLGVNLIDNQSLEKGNNVGCTKILATSFNVYILKIKREVPADFKMQKNPIKGRTSFQHV